MIDSSRTNWVIQDDQMSIPALKRLGNYLKTGRACALVGAGMSAQLGYPTWAGLLDDMGAEISKMGETPQRLNMLAAQKDLLWRAEEYRRLLGTRYRQFMRAKFSGVHAIGEIPSSLRNLVTLNWKHVFTTNYDPALELAHRSCFANDAEELDWQDRSSVREFLGKINHESGGRLYVHLHGKADDPDHIVLTYEDYVRRYVQSDEMAERLFVLFATQCFAFIGFSLDDPDFVQILRQVNSRLGAGYSPAHFAILPAHSDGPFDLERRRLVGKYDVEPIFYRHEEGDRHVHLSAVISTLLGIQEQTADIEVSVIADSPAPGVDTAPDNGFSADPQKNRWGGSRENNGRILSATVSSAGSSLYRVMLSVTATTGETLVGEVVFHLHDSFQPSVRRVSAVNGLASLSLLAYGAFTVGVEADRGSTRLELDLAENESFPEDFRSK